MTVTFATLDGANGFACAFDMGRSMGDCFPVALPCAPNDRKWRFTPVRYQLGMRTLLVV